MAESYYILLGVDADATQDQIRSAYRRKAKQLHPDHYDGGSQLFRSVQEAYEVLSDPVRRRAYDDAQDAQRRRNSASIRTRVEPLRSRGCPVEPLIPAEPPTGLGLDRHLDTLFSVPREGPPWTAVGEPEYIRASVVLTPGQARGGGRFRTWLPVQAACPVCWGHGRVGFATCWECAGAGVVPDERPVTISFPAGLSHGDVVRVPLDRIGLRDVCLLLRFRIAERY